MYTKIVDGPYFYVVVYLLLEIIALLFFDTVSWLFTFLCGAFVLYRYRLY